MKYLILIVISISFASIFSVNAFGQSLYVNPDEDNLIKIKDSKYFESLIFIRLSSSGLTYKDCPNALTENIEANDMDITISIRYFIIITSVVSLNNYLISHF